VTQRTRCVRPPGPPRTHDVHPVRASLLSPPARGRRPSLAAVTGIDLERRLGPRAARSRETRRRIIAAASRLFVADGYLPTTMRAIAREAGVAVQTLYLAFGGKASILAAALDVAIVGDDAPVPLLERPWVAALRAEKDGRRAIALLCREHTELLRREAPLQATMRAATGDADVARLLERDQQNRYATQRQLVAILATKHGFHTELGEERAKDIVYGLLSEVLYLLFCGDRGWSPRAWAVWVTATLSAQLFPLPADE
jgi:AcrR family transcriptional regulator